MDWVEGIGLFAGFLGVSGWYPQVKRVWFEGRADGISVPTFVVICISLTLWLIYGVLKNSIAIIVANIFALLMISSIAIGAYRIQSVN
ncbi:MAG: SemiSWEET family transporter [Candidatus Thermoplasmatota archaeon]|nr:SemiSWEET family transporter [Candidatus Thermoplasmatota archaeon]|tara:strand:+ start:95 stop:358 length:264 start_codon:yes stop_codon:yes gene_type:complete